MKTVPEASFRNRLRVDNSVCFLAALLIMTVPLKWLLASIMAAMVHELGHICLVRLCKGSIRNVEIGPGGVCMYCVPMKPIHSILSIAAGPVMSFALVFLIRVAPRVAISGLVQGLFNLLPFPALDGGRIFFLLIEIVRRKPVNPKYEGYVHLAGLALLFALMIFVTANDIAKIFN